MSLLDSAHPSIGRLLSPLLYMRARVVRWTLGRALSLGDKLQARVRVTPGPPHIAYLANSPVPTKAANCVHVMKICSAFVSNGHRATLLAERSAEFDGGAAKIFEDFGVSPFDICLLDKSRGSLAMEIERVEEGLRRGATHFFGRSLIGCYAAALAGAPSLLERHLPLKDSEYAIAVDLFSQPSFQGLIVISHALRSWYQERFANLAGRIHVLPDAADPPTRGGEFAFAAVEGASFRVGYAGHLYPGKGAEIIAAVAERMPQVSFHILGGHDTDVLRWRTKTTGLNNIAFYGFRPQREVSAFLRELDVVLAPYLRQVKVHGGGEVSAWMSPLKIFECMAHAKPIISSDLPVLREVLAQGVNALLCDPDDIDSWVTAIERLRDDRRLGASLSEQARVDFETNYTWRKRAESIVGILTAPRAAESEIERGVRSSRKGRVL